MCPKVLIMYSSRTGNTEKLARAVADGIKEVPRVDVQMKMAPHITTEDVLSADGYAIGSPSHFSIMSGRILALITDLYPLRDKMISKPMAVFTTGAGGQVTALENIERIIGVFNPRFIKPGVAVEGVPSEGDKEQARKLGKKLAKAVAQRVSK